ncbi:hypothetical protein BY458DRAFT_445377 [Sporodiniella umbellata]|nr:hypothetical protein BY458DRAFT_445377 [Sporodiniella umbellata]
MSSNIFEAAASGDLEYLKKNINSLNDKNERGWTPLHFSARFGQREVAQFLKESKVNLSEMNSEGKTASELATLWGNDAVAKILHIEDTRPSVFPDNHVSVFGGNPLNRFGWKRNDPEFLSKLARSPKSKYIVLCNQQALYNSSDALHTIVYSSVSSIVDKIYTEDGFNQNNSEVLLVFLGIDERDGKGEDGVAYWALDLTPKGKFSNELGSLAKELESLYTFYPTIPRAFVMDKSTSAIIAQAAAMIDWNARNMFCSACGKRTVMAEGGHKRSCVPSESAPKCISHSGVQNFTYPRTGNVFITNRSIVYNFNRCCCYYLYYTPKWR